MKKGYNPTDPMDKTKMAGLGFTKKGKKTLKKGYKEEVAEEKKEKKSK